jgi:predicted dehydrogenase
MRNISFPLKIAFIGCGSISYKHVAALARIPQARIVGAFDISSDARNAFMAKTGIPVFTGIDEMVEKVDPDVFDILTPSGYHGGNVLELMEYHRHFIVEKPLALRLDEVDKIIEECDKRSLRIYVVQQNRFNPPVKMLKTALTMGRFGKLVLGTVRVRWSRDQKYYDQNKWRGTWSLDGGVLTNQASHHIDMLIWMMGDVESVIAKTATRLVKIEAEDTGVAIIKFRSGALGVIEATTAVRPKDLEGSISILGEHGSVEIGGFFMNQLKTWNFTTADPMDTDVWDHHAIVPLGVAWNHSRFFEDVITSLQSGKRGLIDGIEGRKSIELINALYESAEIGKEVNLRFSPKRCRLGEVHD